MSPLIDLTAPSNTNYWCYSTTESFNVWTLDIPGAQGYNPHYVISNTNDPNWCTSQLPSGASYEELPATGNNHLSYTGRFGGTSAATPQVAGVAALMLSVNPALTVAEVHDILLNTADKVGGYFYTWYGHSWELGHGRLNAFGAVKEAYCMANPDETDLYSKDGPEDIGEEPNIATELLWTSPDIWVRNSPDGFEIQEHENPEYVSGSPVYVYVRVRNKGCNQTGGEPVTLYWSKAGTALNWPSYWNGEITSPALMGNEIGTEEAPVLEPGEIGMIQFTWEDVPDPAIYEGIEGIDEPWHFCLLSRIDSPSDPMYDEILNNDWNLAHNVRYNNNIVWKNISIIETPGVGGWPDDKLVGAIIAIGNATDEYGTFKIEFTDPKEYTGKAITEEAEVRITMDETTWNKWVEGGWQSTNIEVSREERYQLIVTGSPATMGNLQYAPHERSLIHVGFNFLTRELTDKIEYLYNVVQRDAQTEEILGGEQYVIRKPLREGFEANAGDDKEALMNENVVLTADDIYEDAIYNWYSPEGELIHTGRDLAVTADITRKYKLEVISEADGFKDYDEVEVKMKPAVLTTIFPNPSSDLVTIGYYAPNSTSAYLLINMPYTGVTNNYLLNVQADEILIDVSNYPTGTYSVILIADGVMVDEISLVVLP